MLVPQWQFLNVSSAADPTGLGEAWMGLARRALVPAGFNRPEIVLPLLAATGDGQLATVESGGELLLALPVQLRRGLPRLVESWSSPVSEQGLCHVDGERANEAIAALLRQEQRPLLLRAIPVSDRFYDALRGAAGHFAILSAWERAALRPQGSYDDWFQGNFEGRRRRELLRHKKRLAGEGQLSFETLANDADEASWVAEFLALEKAGWKGRRGTALACRDGVGRAFAETCRALQRSGHLRFWALRLDGRMIAGLFAVAEGGKCWLGKIAHDEGLARFSPGVLLMLEATRAIFAEVGITEIDSCAIPGHPMVEHLWRDRLAVADIMVAGPDHSRLHFTVAVAAERTRRALRLRLRALYYRLTGRRPS